MKNSLLSFISGILLFGLGVFLLLSNIRVSSLTFYRFGKVSSAPILIILFIVFIVLAVIKSHWVTWSLVVFDIILMIVSVIMGTNFSFKYMSAFDLLAMIVLMSVGLGLFLKGVLGVNKKEGK